MPFDQLRDSLRSHLDKITGLLWWGLLMKQISSDVLFSYFSSIAKAHFSYRISRTIIHCLGLGNETMVCAVCLSIFLWIRDMTRLLRGTFVSWWYLPRLWPSVTDMQHYYHARYPTDDWHLAYMFSLVYRSVDVCLVGVFPHPVSTRRDPCVGSCAPLTLACPPHEKTKIEQGWPGSSLEPSEGAFELTHGSACILGGNLGCWIFNSLL